MIPFLALLLLLPAPTAGLDLPIAIFDWFTDLDENGTRVDESWQLYSTFYVTMTLAVQHFNERRGEFCPELWSEKLRACDKNLTLVRYCDDLGLHQRAVKDAYELVQNHGIKAIAGTVQALESMYVASLMNTVANGAPVVSYWMQSPLVSDKDQFPNFARTGPSDEDFGVIVSAACEAMGFKRVAGLILRGDSGTEFGNSLFTNLVARGIAFQDLSFEQYNPESIDQAVAGLALLRWNVIVVAAYSYDLAAIAASMNKWGLLNPESFFLLTYLDVWPTLNETQANSNLSSLLHGAVRIDRALVQGTNPQWEAFKEQWRDAAHSREFVNAHVPPNGLGNDGSSCVNDDLDLRIGETYFQDTFQELEVLPEVLASAYDAVMAIGLGECHTPSPGVLVEGSDLMRNIVSTEFSGLSGHVRFKVNGDRETVGFRMFNFYRSTPEGGIAYKATGDWVNASLSWHIRFEDMVFKKGGGKVRPTDVTVPVPNLNYLSDGLRVLGYVETGVLWFSNAALHVWLWVHRRHSVVVNSQGDLLHVILTGLWTSSFAVLALTADDSPGDVLDENVSCMAAPVLYVVGFQVVTVALLGKMQRILSLFHNPTLRKRIIRTGTVLMVIFLVVFLEMTVVAAWIFVGPLVWIRDVQVRDRNGFVVESHGYCSAETDASAGFLLTVVFLQLAALVLLGWYANKVKDLPSKFHEARYLALAVVSLGQLFLVCVPVTYAVLQSVNGRFVVTSSLVFFSNLSLLVFVFVPKVVLVHWHWEVFGTTSNTPKVVREVVKAHQPPAAAAKAEAHSNRERSDTRGSRSRVWGGGDDDEERRGTVEGGGGVASG